MFWRANPIRETSELPTDGEAAMQRISGADGLSFSAAGAGRTGMRSEVFRLGNGGNAAPGSRSPESRTQSQESDKENEKYPQPSAKSGVPEDMATMALNPALGNTASGLNPGMPQGRETGAERAEARAWNLARHAAAGTADPASDAAVMLRLAAGDEAGFNYLIEKYHRSIIHFLFRMVHNQAVAEELAQEVFLRVYRSRESYRAEAKFTTWLYRIATNLAVNHARDTRHERNAQTIYLDVPDPESGTLPDVADDEPNVEQRLLRDERMAAIRGHVMELPERQRMAVLMHKYQGMDYRQIGDVLKLSESATKSLLFRAYQTLREKLKGFI
jgi:RNA polymerase sigma-70 factor (ECF subfamily)